MMFNPRPTSLELGLNQTGNDLMSLLTPIITSPLINSPEYMKYLFCNNYYPPPQQQLQEHLIHHPHQQQPHLEHGQQIQPNHLKRELTDEERLRNKRERNRRAAANCRRRKDEKLHQLEIENLELKETVSKLQSELAAKKIRNKVE